MTRSPGALTADDSGTRLTIAVGDRVTVSLPENPTTGYRWVAQADAHLRPVDDRFEGPSQPRGAGGDRVLVFEAIQPGLAHLVIVKKRDWGSPEPVAQFAAQFDVEPPVL